MPIKQTTQNKEIPFTKKASNKANKVKQEKQLTEKAHEAAWQRICDAAKNFNKYHFDLAEKRNASVVETCAAILLENFNMREFFPNNLGGISAYDDIAKTVQQWYAQKNKQKNNTGEIIKPVFEFDNTEWKCIGQLTEDYNRYHKLYGTDYNLSETELAAGLLLEHENLRKFFPENLGGSYGYLALSKTIHTWFEKNKNKSD